jgi:DNA polymerase I
MELNSARDMGDWLLTRAGRPTDPPPTRQTTMYQVVDPATALRAVRGEPHVGLDLETSGLDPLTAAIRLISLATTNATYLVDARQYPTWAPTLEPFFRDQSVEKVLHNAVFDLGFFHLAGVEVTNVFDTMLAAQLLDGGLHLHTTGFFTLASVSKRELHMDLDKELQASDWSSATLSPEQLRYAARDAAVLLPLRDQLTHQMNAAELTGAARVEFAVLPAIAWLMTIGVPFDADVWADLSDAAMLQKLELEEAVRRIAGHALNLNSPKQVQTLLQSVGIQVESTAEQVLHGVIGQHEVVRLLLDHRAAAKKAGTYGIEFLRHVHPKSGRIHARYRQIGAATGRMSCSQPNLQQVPRDKPYRSCFRAPDGTCLVRADLSLVEMCVAADLAGDDRMMHALEAGDDLHAITAAALFEKDVSAITPEERAFGKVINFGALYGQGHRGLQEQARQRGLHWTDAEAEEMQQRFGRAWPKLSAWQQRLLRGGATTVRTRSGRIRRLGPDARGTQAVNTPVQGTAADGFKLGLAELWRTRSSFPSAVPVLAVHDELVIQCALADAPGVAEWVAECLQAGMARLVPRVPVRVDVAISQSWAGDTP